MPTAFDFSRLKKFMIITTVIQVFLVALLVYLALHFQAGLAAGGKPEWFIKGIVIALVVQLALFYPIRKFAEKEALREIDSSAFGLTPEELRALRTRRMISDVIKMAVLAFFIIFLLAVAKPAMKLIVWPAYLTFILTVLAYFQCFQFAVRREMRAKS